MVRRFALAPVIAVALQSSPAGAIVSNPLPRVCNEFPHSDYVFSGRVLSETSVWPQRLHGEGERVYRIRVDHVFKGRAPSDVSLVTPADSGGGALDAGQPAIIFAQRYAGQIAFSGSSNTQSGAGVPKIVTQIRNYLAHPPKVATISGRIDNWERGHMAGFRGARLLITNGSIRRFVRADDHGIFVVTVPPGRWSVRIAEPGWASRTGVYSYDSAEGTKLARGGCADLQIEAAAPNERLEGLPHWALWPK